MALLTFFSKSHRLSPSNGFSEATRSQVVPPPPIAATAVDHPLPLALSHSLFEIEPIAKSSFAPVLLIPVALNPAVFDPPAFPSLVLTLVDRSLLLQSLNKLNIPPLEQTLSRNPH